MLTYEKLMHWRPAQKQTASEIFYRSFILLELITKEPKALWRLLDLENIYEQNWQAIRWDALQALKWFSPFGISLPGVEILTIPF